jgi:hypothetical protein
MDTSDDDRIVSNLKRDDDATHEAQYAQANTKVTTQCSPFWRQ